MTRPASLALIGLGLLVIGELRCAASSSRTPPDRAPPTTNDEAPLDAGAGDADSSLPDPASSSPADASALAEPGTTSGADAGPPFVPPDVGPMASSHRSGDGQWTAVHVANDSGAALLYKTVLHPDAAHPGAELFVIAFDVSRVRLHSVAGAIDPEAALPAAKQAPRPAVVPSEHHSVLLAAFNGGWKSEHGHYGMKTDGVTFAAPNDAQCTVLAYEDDDTLRIAPWKTVASTVSRMRFFRQTPACLYAGGVRHPGLAVELTRNWGADAEGNAIIRRSAIGLDERGRMLLVAVSNPMSAPAIANGMHHAGAHDVAELDVNWSFPKFLVYRPNATSGLLDAESLFPNFVFDKAEYVRKRSPRDFFYVVRR